MALIRFLGRSLFSSLFIADGVKLITNSDKQTAEVDAATETIVPAAQSVLPENISTYIPQERRTWSRILGGVQILGGFCYATGIGRRFGATLLTVSAIPKVIGSVQDEDQDNEDLLGNLSLLGAGIVATRDLHGNPSLSWRTGQARRKLAKRSKETADEIQSGIAETGRRARKQAKKAAKRAQKAARKANN